MLARHWFLRASNRVGVSNCSAIVHSEAERVKQFLMRRMLPFSAWQAPELRRMTFGCEMVRAPRMQESQRGNFSREWACLRANLLVVLIALESSRSACFTVLIKTRKVFSACHLHRSISGCTRKCTHKLPRSTPTYSTRTYSIA